MSHHLEQLPSGIVLIHEGPPPEVHGNECWRVHHECAVRKIEEYRKVMHDFMCETDGGVNDPEGLRFVFERVAAGVHRREARIKELEARIEGMVEP